MEEMLDLSQTQRIVFLIDLQPLFHLQNPNPYVSSVLASARTLLTFPSLSSSLFAFKLFFSSLSPVLSSSKLHCLLGKSAATFSFEHPSETLVSLSETLNSLPTLSDTLISPSRALLTASSLHQLVHDYAWETQIQDLIGTTNNFPVVRSNLIILFSPVSRSLKCLSKFMDVETDDESFTTEDEFCKKFFQVFGNLSEGFVNRDIHFSWIDVNYELECSEERVKKDKSLLCLGFVEKGIKNLGWGFCSTDAIILGSALVPFGLIYPNIGYSLMGISPNDSGKKVCAELSLKISDVSGKPLECRCCDLELVDFKMPCRQRSGNISQIWESKNSSVGHFDQAKIVFGNAGDPITKICVREVWKNNESMKIKDSLCDFAILRGFSGECGKEQRGDNSGGFFADRVLEMLRMKTSEFTPGKPIWQVFLTFLHRQRYWALVSVSNGDGLTLMGILKPFTVHLAFLCIFDSRFSSTNLPHDFDGFSSGLVQKFTKRVGEIPKDTAELNNLDALTASCHRTSYMKSPAYQDCKITRNKKCLKSLQDLSWSSFCKAALSHSELDLEDIYISRACNNSKKLRFLKCWMKQSSRSSRCFQNKLNESKPPSDIQEEMKQRLAGSEQESEQPASSSFSTEELFLTGASNVNGEVPPASCSETSEVFFSGISQKIRQGLESEEVDLGALAERLVSSSIHWLYCKHEMMNTMENSATEEQPEEGCGGMVVAELVKLLLREPKDVALKYKSCDAQSLTSDSSSAMHTSENKVREYELQIFFRMEILRSKVGVSIEKTAKQKMVKQICSLLENIQYHLAGGFFGDISLDKYVGRTIRNRYSESLEDVVCKIYTRMDLLLFNDDDGEALGSLVNSEDGDEAERDKLDENEIGGNAGGNTSTSVGKSSQLKEIYIKSPRGIRDKEYKCNLMEARERRERARRFSSFTSWVPDLQRVWAPKQPWSVRAKSESLRKLPKRKESRGAQYYVVHETPMTGKKRSCTRDSTGDEEQTNYEIKSGTVSKALFQDNGDVMTGTIP